MLFVFVKQKTAYEMRISDWSSDVCSSDLLSGATRAPVMMLACPELRVVPVTVHLPLRRVPEVLTTARIVETGRTTAEGLRRLFGIARPRLAVAGLNPHAGEGGQLGAEDDAVIDRKSTRLNSSH